MPGTIAAELALPDPGESRRRFGRAARSFASASFIHDEARRRLLDRLDGLKITPGLLVDLGAALGQGATALAAAYPEASVLAVDVSPAMLERRVDGRYLAVVGDAEQLPLPDRSVDLLFANLVLPWTRPDAVFAEARRVLKPEGVLTFTSFGPETLQELRRAWSRVDDAIHVHGFLDAQTTGDLAVKAGLEEPVVDVDRIRVTYGELSGVIRDLRACGATNTARGRRRGLTGRACWQGFVEALWREQGAGQRGRLGMTVELVLGQAFGASAASRSGAGGEVVVPLDALDLSSRRKG